MAKLKRNRRVRCSAWLDHVVVIHKKLRAVWQRNHGKGIEDSKARVPIPMTNIPLPTLSGTVPTDLENRIAKTTRHAKTLELKVTMPSGLTIKLSDPAHEGVRLQQ